MVIARHEWAALADEEIEIRALARLVDVVEVKAPVAALERRLRRLPFLPPARDLLLGHEELEPPLRYVELDLVAVLDERQEPAGRRLRRHVQHDRAVSSAAHAGIGYAHHVGD